jgi:hypothetical protein
MSEAERQDVIQRLRRYADQLQELMDLISDKSSLTREEKTRAQTQMKAIKEALNDEYRRGATARGQAAMNPYEDAYLHRAVHQASTQIRARWNSDPINSNWFSELYAARIDITYPLHQLENQEPEAR